MSKDREAAISAFVAARRAKSDEGMADAQAKYDAALDVEDVETQAAWLSRLPSARYTEDERQKILAAFISKQNFDADDFWRQMQKLIDGCLPAGGVTVPLPSDQKRALQQLQNQARKVAAALNQRPSDIRHNLQAAALEGNDMNADLARFDDALSQFNWLCRVIDRAHEKAASGMKKAARREDTALLEFTERLDALYRASAANPRNPYVDKDGEGQGELMWLMHACLYPIGKNLARAALVGLWQRATGRSTQRR